MSGHEQRPGDWRVICALSGFKAWASDCVKDDATGRYVLRRFADQRHPQDFRKPIPDDPSVPFAQPERADTFVAPGDVTPADL